MAGGSSSSKAEAVSDLKKEDPTTRSGWLATGWFQQQAAHFAALQASPRQIWVIFALKLLESYAYFASAVRGLSRNPGRGTRFTHACSIFRR